MTEMTTRQEDVLVLVAAGLSNAEIGAALGITPRGAKFHVDALRKKFGCDVKRQLVGVCEREMTNRRRTIIHERIARRNGQ